MDHILITDCDHPDIEVEQSVFATVGLDARLAQCRTEDDVLAAGTGAVALLVQYAPVGAKVLDGLPRCRVVAGMEPAWTPSTSPRLGRGG